MKEALYDELSLKTIVENTQEKKEKFVLETKEDLIKIVAKKRTVKIKEKLLSWEIHVDGRLASVWTPYEFYINGKLSHSGVNVFTLFKNNGVWTIISIIDTRRRP